MRAVMLMFKFMSEEKANYAYASGKWTVKEVFGHMIDTESIMGYRALAISRGEKQSLPGFDENEYVVNSNFRDQKLGDILERYKMVRYSNVLLAKSFTSDMLNRVGTANGNEMNVRALTYIIAGHELHHIEVLRTKYEIKS